MRRARSSGAGFTLLETVVAMAILSMALMAIFNLNAGAVAMHSYTKRLTVASLLARAKMTDLEQKLYEEGFSVDDDEDDGDFSEEGWPSFKWRAKILAPKTEGLPPEQLLAALFNIPLGGGGEEGDPLSGLGALFGGGAAGAQGAAGAAGMAGAAGAMGGMGGMAQGMMTQLVDQITKTVREVHLTVYWKDGDQVESIDLVTHVVAQAPGDDRNGGAAGAAQANNPAAQQLEQMQKQQQLQQGQQGQQNFQNGQQAITPPGAPPPPQLPRQFGNPRFGGNPGNIRQAPGGGFLPRGFQ